MPAAPTPEEKAVADENAKKRKKSAEDEPDVIGHTFEVTGEPGEDDPERKRKRKRKQSDQPETDELGRKRK